MSVNTVNSYGNISVTDESIALVVGHTALDCYGVVDLVARKFSDAVSEFFRGKKQSKSRGVKILTVGDRIHIDLDIILKYGVSINAVAESVRRSVKYNVEQFTGMIVDSININVIGVKV
ncbi:MAG: Asp23/Gls24 family envelope stress response protein [Clostridia bacterium]|nr:Asp23/Gls24 family envelope stress response protein [Clostridia bacterium]